MHFIQFLVNAGASKTVTDDDGKTPFDLICLDVFPDCSEPAKLALEKLLRL